MTRLPAYCSFLLFIFVVKNIFSLSLQACIYCFDKAANENATRSQYKLNMRIYYEDFLSALTSAAMFRYSGGGKQDSSSLLSDQRRKNFEKIINSSSNSFAMKVRPSETTLQHPCVVCCTVDSY